MQFSLSKSVLRIILLALFVTCVGLVVTTGQASAHSAWDGGCDSNHSCHDGCDSDHGCYGGCDSDHGCYGDGYGSSHVYNVSDNCDQWDPRTGYCMHWKLNISSDPVYDSAYHSNSRDYHYYYNNNYHDADYYYRSYCDRYKCDCK